MQQPLYGLIGGKLGHSYSKIIHEKIADYTYELLPLPTEAEARTFMEKRAFAAINVTIPYKQFVIPYCDVVDPKAQSIGAVNTIVNRDGKLYGYNTDYAGFAYLAGVHGVDFAGKTVLILGTGGTHSTVTAVCRDGGAKEILTASRTARAMPCCTARPCTARTCRSSSTRRPAACSRTWGVPYRPEGVPRAGGRAGCGVQPLPHRAFAAGRGLRRDRGGRL